MTSKTKRALVPELRFPEFRDAGEWEVKPLGLLGRFIGGGTPIKAKPEYWQGDIPWISSSDLLEDNIHTVTINKFISLKAIEESATKKVPKGSVLFVSRVGTGKLAINDRDLCTSQDFSNFISTGIYNYYLAYYSLANKSALIGFGQGTSIKGFSKDDIENFKVSFPQKKEQQKIADCLSSLDDLTALEARKLDALKAHKKGLMQQLFPAEGETLPKLRFPEFQDAGEWVEKAIGSVCKMFSGGTPVTSQKSFYGGNIPFIRSAEIDKETTELFLTQEGLDNSAAKLVAKGDLLVALYGANSGNVSLAKIDGAINQAILCLKSENSNVFLYQYLSHRQSRIVSTHIQGGQGNLSGDIVRSLKVCYPSKNEQQKIADCLSSLDDLIALQTRKLDALKAHKKGLLQQLFPSIEEVRK